MSNFEEFIDTIRTENLAEVKKLFNKEFISKKDSVSLLKSLINNGLQGGWNALHCASMWNNNGDIADYLVNEGWDMEAEDDFGGRSIHYAAERGGVAVIRVLIENGCCLRSLTKRGESASDLALKCGQSEECLEIIKRAETAPSQEKSASVLSLEYGQSEECLEIIKRVEAQRISNFDEFRDAIRREDLAEVKKLFNKEFIIKRYGYGWTALHCASCYNYKGEIVEFLVNEGCDMEAEDIFGRRSIYVATERGRVAVVRVLTKRGCGLKGLTKYGDSGSDLTLTCEQNECLEIIKRAEALKVSTLRQTNKDQQPGAATYPICPICDDEVSDCALNCGHIFGMNCAKMVDNCFTCRRSITNRIKLYQ